MRGIHRKFYHLITHGQSYDDLLLECYKVARYAQGGAPVDYLKNLPLDELRNEITIVNKAAAQERQLIEAESA